MQWILKKKFSSHFLIKNNGGYDDLKDKKINFKFKTWFKKINLILTKDFDILLSIGH